MSILAKHYKLIDKLVIANNETVNINPDTPYTVTYLISDRDCAQITGIIRGVMSGDIHTIVVIPLDAEDVNFATVIDTYKITKISSYNFQAHFENFNNWIGVEVAEKSRIDLRVRYTSGESIVAVEQGNTYNISYVEKVDGKVSLIEGTGKIKSIIRSTTKEALPQHINYFTNDIDYILVVDFANSNYASDVRSINVTEIRSIALALTDDMLISVDKSELNVLILSCNSFKKDDYAHASWDRLMSALVFGGQVNSNANATQEDVEKAIDMINKAIDDLKSIDDEYDLVEYDKESNTLYCHESYHQVLIKGKLDGEYNEIYYMTNFGSHKVVAAARDLNIVWASSGVDIARRKPRPKGRKLSFNGDPSNLFVCDDATINNAYLGHKIIRDKEDPEKVIDNSIIFKASKCGINNIFFGGLDTDHVGTGNKAFLYAISGAQDYFSIYGKWHPLDIDEEAENLDTKLRNNTVVCMGSCLDEESCMEEPETGMLLNVVKSNLKEIYMGGINSYSKFCECALFDSAVLNIYMSGLGSEAETLGSAINMKNSRVGKIVYISEDAVINSTSVTVKKCFVDEIIVGADQDGPNAKFNLVEEKEDGTTADNKLMLLMGDGTVVGDLWLGYSEGEPIPTDHIVITKEFLVKNDNDGLLVPNEEAIMEYLKSDPDRATN